MSVIAQLPSLSMPVPITPFLIDRIVSETPVGHKQVNVKHVTQCVAIIMQLDALGVLTTPTFTDMTQNQICIIEMGAGEKAIASHIRFSRIYTHICMHINTHI